MEQELRKIGLSEYEIKVYLTLLRYGSLNSKKLSELSTVPQSKIYDVLYRLADKIFVSILNVKPKSFKAIEPEIAIRNYLRSKKYEIEKLEEELPKKLKELKKLRIKEPETEEKITVYRGRKNTLPFLNSFYIRANKYIKNMYTFEYLPASFLREVKKCTERGVKIQMLATNKSKEIVKMMKKIKKLGTEVRYYPVSEIRLGIRDGVESYQSIVNPKDIIDRTTLAIDSRELTKALEHYFDYLWNKAEKI